MSMSHRPLDSALTQAPAPLPPVKRLISESWKHFTAEWKRTFLISRWIILPGALTLAIVLLERFGQEDLGIFLPIVAGGAFLLNAWVEIGLIRHELDNSHAKETSPFTADWKNVAAYLWTDVWHGVALIGMLLPFFLALVGVVVAVAGTQLAAELLPWLLIPALVLLVPFLWMSVSLAFWPFILLDSSPSSPWEELRGPSRFPSLNRTVALFVASYKLVRGRWWQVFLRFVVPGFVFGVVFLASVSIVDFLIELIAGPAKMEALFGSGVLSTDVNSSSRNGYSYFLQSLGLAVFFPLSIGWQARLYKMLKKED